MSGSTRIGKVSGVCLSLHWTFFIFTERVAASWLLSGRGWVGAVESLTMVLAVFASAVLHELGHFLAAVRFGPRPRDITLLPIGGVARVEAVPEDPDNESLVAVAGPAVNLALVLLFYAILTSIGESRPLHSVHGFVAKLAVQLLWINWYLAILNLLPVLPMDGGRMFRALLTRWLPYGEATRIAAHAGQAMAVFIVFVVLAGFFWNWWLLLVALFVYFGAAEEIHYVQETYLSAPSV